VLTKSLVGVRISLVGLLDRLLVLEDWDGAAVLAGVGVVDCVAALGDIHSLGGVVLELGVGVGLAFGHFGFCFWFESGLVFNVLIWV
jgi:hypothetical protein